MYASIHIQAFEWAGVNAGVGGLILCLQMDSMMSMFNGISRNDKTT